MTLDVRPVEGRKGVDEFIRFSWEVYRNNPLWVPPIVRDVRKFLMGESLFFKHCVHRLFAAYENKKITATMAAFYDTNLVQRWKKPVGLLGYFEALPEKEHAVKALFEEAELYLRQKGAETAWGPVNGGGVNPVGLLANAYNQPPVFLMMYNPSYYHQYFRRMGYYPVKELIAYSADLLDGKLRRKIAYVLKRGRRSALRVRCFDMKRFREESDKVSEIYSLTFHSHWGYSAQTKDEYFELLQPMRLALDPDFILLAEHEGKTVGFAFGVPDYNSVIKQLNGNLELLNGLAFLRMKKKIREGRIIAIGVSPEWRGQRVAPLLTAHIYDGMIQKGYIKCEYSWVAEENIASQNVARKFNDDAYKHYYVYERQLTKDAAKRFLR